MKKIVCILAVMLMISSVLCACGKEGYKPAGNGGTTEAMSEKVVDKNIDHKKVDSDTNVGLMSIKMNNTGKYELNDTEKLLIQYFDDDYIDVDYKALQRYPQIYENTQIEFIAKVKKIIESNNDEYTALCIYGWYSSADDGLTDYVVIKGKQQETRIIENDYIKVYGKYTAPDNYTVDGKSYNVPTVLVNRVAFGNEEGGEELRPMYSVNELKMICRYIFGDNITIREFNWQNDNYDYAGFADFYVCELENQGNANFSKYILEATQGTWFEDMNSDNMANQTGILKNLTFSADFEHFYYKSFDTNLDVFTIACYDKNLNKIWSREFEQTTSEVYDYTPDHLYIVANGTMYIIDAETGENAVEPKYVGQKDWIRKVEDGILLVQTNTKSDAIMKTDLVGNVKWTANTSVEFSEGQIQIPDGGNYVITYSGEGTVEDEYGYCPNVEYAMVLQPDGTIVYDSQIF